MVYVFLADGFEEIEALTPVDILRRAGVCVQTVGVNGKTVTGSHAICVNTDLVQDEVTTDALEGIVLPGGKAGTENLEKSETVQSMIDYCCEHGLMIGAICAAPSILGHKNLLQGKKAVSFPDFQKELAGAVIGEEFVCTDGHIITAKGAGVSLDFALELVRYLVNTHKSDEIKGQIQCGS